MSYDQRCAIGLGALVAFVLICAFDFHFWAYTGAWVSGCYLGAEAIASDL